MKYKKENNIINEKIKNYEEIIKNLKNDKEYLLIQLDNKNIEINNLKNERKQLEKKNKHNINRIVKDIKVKKGIYNNLINEINTISSNAITNNAIKEDITNKKNIGIDKMDENINKIEEKEEERYYEKLANESKVMDKIFEKEKIEKEKKKEEEEKIKKEEEEKIKKEEEKIKNLKENPFFYDIEYVQKQKELNELKNEYIKKKMSMKKIKK